MHIPEVAYPVHTDDSNLDLIPRPAGQRGPSTLDRLKVTNTVARKPGREEAGKLMVTAAESKRGPSKIQPLDLPRGRVNDSQLCTARQLLSHCIYPYHRNFSLFSPYISVSLCTFVQFVPAHIHMLAIFTFTINHPISIFVQRFTHWIFGFVVQGYMWK